MTAAFTPQDLAELLGRVRSNRPLSRSPIYDLDIVILRVAQSGQVPLPAASKAAAAEILREIVRSRLAERREANKLQRGSPAPPLSAEEEIALDFSVQDTELERWSALYYRYLAPRTFQVQQLVNLTQPRHDDASRRLIGQRIKLGKKMLAERLAEAEQRARSTEASREDRPPRRRSRRSSFVGREAEMETAFHKLVCGGLVTLTGPAGVGKTRLAHQLAELHEADYPGGIWWVELERIDSAHLVYSALARAGGVVETPNQDPISTAVAALHRRGPSLIVLDGCEHLASTCADLAAKLLDQADHVQVLITSQQRLGIDGEFVLAVPPLPVLDAAAAERQSLEQLRQCPSVALFVDRATSIRHNFELTKHDAAAVITVCRLVDGLPLAIELAAGRLTSLSLSQLEPRLTSALLETLIDTVGGDTGKPQAMYDVVTRSLALLSPHEKLLLERLAIFQGGWTLAAAEQVCDAADEALKPLHRPPIDLLTGLVDKSVVFVEEREGAVRYQMLHVVEAQARAQLSTSIERPALLARHLDWCIGLADRANHADNDPRRLCWIDRVAAEFENLQAALEFANRSAPIDGLRLAIGLSPYWQARGLLSEGRRWLGRFLASVPADVDQELLALGYREAGLLARMQGAFPTAQICFERALGFAQSLRLPGLEAKALVGLGGLATRQGDNARATELYDRALAIFRTIGDAAGEGTCLHNLGLTAYHLEDYATARSRLEASVANYRAGNDPDSTGKALSNLGRVLAAIGDLDAAELVLSEGRQLAASIGNTVTLAGCDKVLGFVAAERGDWPRARSFYRSAVMAFRSQDDQFRIAGCLAKMAVVLRAEGHLACAVESLGAASMLRERLGITPMRSDQDDEIATLEAIRDVLGPEATESHWHIGRSQSWERAVDNALEPSAS